MRDESSKYKQILDTAINADRVVREKYEQHKNAIQLLSKPQVLKHFILHKMIYQIILLLFRVYAVT